MKLAGSPSHQIVGPDIDHINAFQATCDDIRGRAMACTVLIIPWIDSADQNGHAIQMRDIYDFGLASNEFCLTSNRAMAVYTPDEFTVLTQILAKERASYAIYIASQEPSVVRGFIDGLARAYREFKKPLK